jgi:transcriptional regulator with AAA-type ATPase domain/tetratricopeptide (TPR) repeat protein
MIRMDELLGVSRAIAVVREQTQQLLARGQRAHRLPPILLQGETGTGKGLLARLLHRGGPRRDGPFIDVSCAAIPDALFEAELFGFERGAFTDARHAKPGLLHAAHRGTLFLDEVALLPESLQAKLLKAIEEQAVRRLGGTRAETIDVQIIAASNEDLAAAARTRRFRNDLYHRLAVVTLTLPPLRERPQDVLLLAEHFLARACADYGLLPPKSFAPDAQSALQEYCWPGNVRELSNVVESAVLLAEKSTITAAMLRLPPRSPTGVGWSRFDDRLGDVEREQLLAALQDNNWNVSRAAIRLGISRGRLRYRIEKHHLHVDRYPLRSGQRHARPTEPATPTAAVDQPATATATELRWERQHLALLRAELVPPTTAGPPPDPARALTVIADKIRSFGGCIQELATLTIVGVFGLEPVENAPNSAALAALAIQKAAERARRGDSLVPAVKLAVHAAQLMVGRVNGLAQINLEDKRATETTLAAIGDVGQANSILISAAAAPFLERRFELARDVPVEGGAGPLYRLTRPERTGFGLGGRALAQFVGRQRELAVVGDQLGQAERDRGQIVAVVGEPGVGKSRLVYELTRADRVRGWRILSCRAVSYGLTTPSLPVVELLKGYFQIDDAETASQIREKISQKILRQDSRLECHLPALLALLDVSSEDPLWRALEPAQRRQRTIDAVKHVLLQESLAQPLMVIFEDLHWIDTETQGLLDSLAESLPAARVLLLVTYRPEYQHRWGAKTYYTQLRIDPLPPENANELLDALLGDDADLRQLRRLLIERTEGNPFFLEESVRTLIETGLLTGERGAYRLATAVRAIDVPATVKAVLAARIDRLPPEEKRLLHTAAVIGKDTPYALLQAIAELPEDALGVGLTHLQAAEFLYEVSVFPDLAYTFKHALTHEVAYNSLRQDQRAVLHSRIVEAIERRYPDRLAEHVEALGRHALRGAVWDKAVHYLRRAGQKAAARFANREAVAWFEQALAALAYLPETRETIERGIDLRIDLRNSLLPLGEMGRMLESLREAETLADSLNDQPRLSMLCSHIALGLWQTANTEDALAYGSRALAIADALGNFALRVPANNYLGYAYYGLGAYDRAIEFFARNVEALRGDLLHERFGVAVRPSVLSRVYLVFCLSELGDFSEALARGSEGMAITETADQPFDLAMACWGLGHFHLRRGDLHRAIRVLERALGLCNTFGILNIHPNVASLLGYAFRPNCRGKRPPGVGCRKGGGDAAAISTFASDRLAWRSAPSGRAPGRRDGACSTCTGLGDPAQGTRPRGMGAAPPRGDCLVRKLSGGPQGRGAVWGGRDPGQTTRHEPPRRPLPPGPRQVVPAHGPARAGARALDYRDCHVPRDGHAVLAGTGGGRAYEVDVSAPARKGHAQWRREKTEECRAT